MTEEWRPVVGFPNYEVSDLGNVRSLDACIWYGPRVGFGLRQGRVLKLSVDGQGYLTVRLTGKKTAKVHRLVGEAFLGKPPLNHETRHLDGDRSNPRLSNLRYGTRRENRMDAYQHGTCNPEKDKISGQLAARTKAARYSKSQIRSGFMGISYSKGLNR